MATGWPRPALAGKLSRREYPELGVVAAVEKSLKPTLGWLELLADADEDAGDRATRVLGI